MARVQLLHHSYERYGKPGDRGTLTELRQGDVFEADGPELERLLDLRAVSEVDGTQQSQVTKRIRAEYELAITRHDQAQAEHETLAQQPNVAAETVDRSAMNVEALRGERERLGRLARRSDDSVKADPASAPAPKPAKT